MALTSWLTSARAGQDKTRNRPPEAVSDALSHHGQLYILSFATSLHQPQCGLCEDRLRFFLISIAIGSLKSGCRWALIIDTFVMEIHQRLDGIVVLEPRSVGDTAPPTLLHPKTQSHLL